jgi:hypothetical protein
MIKAWMPLRQLPKFVWLILSPGRVPGFIHGCLNNVAGPFMVANSFSVQIYVEFVLDGYALRTVPTNSTRDALFWPLAPSLLIIHQNDS